MRMKRILLLLLIIIGLGGCGKKEKGVFLIENKSDYTITCGIGQNYELKNYTIESGKFISINWQHYINWYIIETPLNIITWEETKEKVVIKNNTNIYKYRVVNNLPKSIQVNNKPMNISIRLLDKEQGLLSQNKRYVTYIDINTKEPYTDIALFRRITKENIFISCLDENKNEAEFNFSDGNEKNSKTYKIIENINGLYFQEIDPTGKNLVVSQIEIKIVEVKSEYVDENGKKCISILPTIFISKIKL